MKRLWNSLHLPGRFAGFAGLQGKEKAFAFVYDAQKQMLQIV